MILQVLFVESVAKALEVIEAETERRTPTASEVARSESNASKRSITVADD